MDTLTVALLLIVVVAITVVVVYNGIVSRKNAAERGWAGVITQERQKDKILPELEKVVSEHKGFESTVLKDITSLRAGLSNLKDGVIETEMLFSWVESSIGMYGMEDLHETVEMSCKFIDKYLGSC